MMAIHVVATFLVVCFIALEWAETLNYVIEWEDVARSSLFTLAVGYILVIGWMR